MIYKRYLKSMVIKRCLIILMVLMAIWVGKTWLGKISEYNNDYRIAWINDSGIQMKSISVQRKMSSVMEIGGEVRVWIPGGLGWYEANKVEKLLRQENQQGKGSDILFYNFGFVADKIIYANEGEGIDWKQIFLDIGQSNMMIKRQKIGRQLSTVEEILSEVMPRDFADSRIVEEGIKISVFNLGVADGLASFVARNLEWSGLAVMGIENKTQTMGAEKCLLNFGDNVEQTISWKLLQKRFPDCDRENSKQLGNGEVELYLSDNIARMIDYKSYNN
jgi:hypothetical protein